MGVIRVDKFDADVVVSLNSLLEDKVSEGELSKIFEESRVHQDCRLCLPRG